MKLDALKQVQALYDAAGLGPLNFKFRSPYNWHLMKSRSTSLGDNKNRPGKEYKKKTDEPKTSS
jgi:hypothetical protein